MKLLRKVEYAVSAPAMIAAMKDLIRSLLWLGVALHVCASVQAEQRSMTVYAAASLTNVLQDAGAEFTRNTGVALKFSFAASSALARQIEAGAPADAFFSADEEWMDYLQTRELLQAGSRQDIASNQLVLIAPKDSKLKLKIEPDFKLAAALGADRLATGDPDSVPVGKYAKAALIKLNVWQNVSSRIVGAENVRAALAFVDRGEAPLGIVYESDALVDTQVRIVDVFPAGSHPRITYPAAMIKNGNAAAKEFINFVRSDNGKALLKKYGFTPL